jgi:hypothetical protein
MKNSKVKKHVYIVLELIYIVKLKFSVSCQVTQKNNFRSKNYFFLINIHEKMYL